MHKVNYISGGVSSASHVLCGGWRLFLLLLLLPLLAQAQNETDHWYFGKNAGLDFGAGLFAVLPDGVMDTPAGCSSISDHDGNLLFYTNGQTVWNRHHQVMEGGAGLVGEIELGESALIIPNPADENRYYLLYLRRTQVGTSLYPGLYYAEVVFSAEFPDGAVTGRDVRVRDQNTSRLTAVYHYPSNTVRVVAFGSLGPSGAAEDTFFIYTVSDEGLVLLPKIIQGDIPMNPIGQMKLSPDGKWLAVAEQMERWVYLYRFDNDALEITHDRSLNPDDFGAPKMPYGVEFSQDSRIFYFTAANTIKQLALYPDPDEEETVIPRIGEVRGNLGSLQLARNGKIYAANFTMRNEEVLPYSAIGVIHKPEKRGVACDFESNGVVLSPGQSKKGLPGFVTSFLRPRIITEDLCIGESSAFDLDAYAPVTAAHWTFGDGATANGLTPTHVFTTPGRYLVKADATYNNRTVSLYKEIIVHELPTLDPTTVMQQCDPDNDGRALFNLYNIKERFLNQDYEYTFEFYHSLNDAQNGVNAISASNSAVYTNIANPETIFVRATNDFGCSNIGSFQIEAVFNTLSTVKSVSVCDDSDGDGYDEEGRFDLGAQRLSVATQLGLPAGSVVVFYPSFEAAQTKTDALPDDFTSASATLWIRVEDGGYGCVGIGTLELIVQPGMELDIESDYQICTSPEEPVTVLDGGGSNTTWKWETVPQHEVLATQREFPLTTPGRYQLTVTRTRDGVRCEASKVFNVRGSGEVVFESVVVDNDKINVRVKGASSYEFSLDNEHFSGSGLSHQFTGVPSGVHTVYVRDAAGCEDPIQQEVLVVAFPTYFTPNGDGHHDTWSIGLIAFMFREIEISIFDRYGKLLYQMNMKDNLGWDGTYQGRPLPASDYWYSARLTDKQGNVRHRKGHFSLLR